MKVEEINKAYECCKNSFHRHCDDCPVTDDCCHDKMPLFVLKYALEMLKEQKDLILALEQSNAANEYLNAEVERLTGLLKEQEAVKPEREHSGGGTTWWNVCGNCKTAINPNDKFCHECGKQVKWE